MGIVKDEPQSLAATATDTTESVTHGSPYHAALAVTDGNVDFDAIDGEPVRILFLLVGPPDSMSQHVRILSRISRLMNRDEVRDRVLATESATSLVELIEESENRLMSK